MKKILITGATGFIGNYVVAQLLQKGYNVIATSSDMDKAKKAEWYSKVKYIPFDLKRFDESVNYFTFFECPDAMIHLAWEGLPNYKEVFHVEENLPRHYKFLKNIIQNGLKDITVSGTCLEYGMKEGCLIENMDCEPGNPYAIAKNELRKKLELLTQQDEFQFHFKWVRIFYMHGKGQGPNSLISQLDKALETSEPVFNMSGGEQERDFLSVEKVADYIVKIALQNKVLGVINCCSGKPVAVRQFVEDYLKQQNKSIRLNLGYYQYTDYEPMKFWGDNKKLKKIVND
ncbi:MAG: NAD(P)-dependent oxidoreductase [Chitinophagaceae bacterium]|nr:NAD(P)-dependent oxidoreductase [Chitinophagaceae bacterium]